MERAYSLSKLEILYIKVANRIYFEYLTQDLTFIKSYIDSRGCFKSKVLLTIESLRFTEVLSVSSILLGKLLRMYILHPTPKQTNKQQQNQQQQIKTKTKHPHPFHTQMLLLTNTLKCYS